MDEQYVQYMEIPVAKLVIPLGRAGDFQRNGSDASVERIVRNFQPLKLGALQVGLINGEYLVWEGSRRLRALRILGKPVAPCTGVGHLPHCIVTGRSQP